MPLDVESQITNALVARCAAGDAAAWEQLVRQQSRRVYNLCYRFTGSAADAEDLAQEVFVKIFRTLASFDPDKAAFTTWMTTVARNLLVDHYRRSRQDRETDSMDAAPAGEPEGPRLGDRIEDPGPGPEERVRVQEKQQRVHQALQQLSPELREAVVLRDLQDMDYKEIAAALGIPQGTVKSRINRGRGELARALARIN